nr:PHB depolymerase family esterase [Frankia sp. AgPm24]
MYRGGARPLVIMLHGLLNNAETLRQASSADSFADSHDFAVAYGVGVHEAWNAGGCCGNVLTDDVAYVRQIVADAARVTPVDRSRIYVWGFSNGGMLAARIACDAPDLVAGVGMVGGQALVSCPEVPVRLVHIHGTADTTVPWRGGWSSYLTMFLPDGETESTHFAPGSTIRHVLWDGGHSWPWWAIGALWDFSAPLSLDDATSAPATTATAAATGATGMTAGTGATATAASASATTSAPATTAVSVPVSVPVPAEAVASGAVGEVVGAELVRTGSGG